MTSNLAEKKKTSQTLCNESQCSSLNYSINVGDDNCFREPLSPTTWKY